MSTETKVEGKDYGNAVLVNTIAPLPETERGYGFHLYAITRKPSQKQAGGDKMIYTNGRCVVIRDLATPSKAVIFTEHKAKVNVANFSPNGEWVASGDSEGNVMIWGTDSLIVKNTFPVGKSIKDICWDSEGKRIVAVGDGAEAKAKVFSWDSGNSLGEISFHSKVILSCSYRQTRPFRIVTSSEDNLTNFYEGPPFKFNKSETRHQKYPNCVRFSPDGAFYASVGSDSKIFVYTGDKGEFVKELESKDQGHKGAIYSFAWSPDSKQILTASADRTAKIWNIEDGTVAKTFTFTQDVGDMQMAALWHGSYLVTVSLNGAINYLDVDNPSKPKQVIHGHKDNIQAAAFDRVHNTYYVSDLNGGKVSAWDMKSQSAKWLEGKGHEKTVVALAVNATGEVLATAGLDDKIRFNKTAEGKFSIDALAVGGKPQAIAAGTKNANLYAVITANQKLLIIINGEIKSTTELPYAPLGVAFNADDSELVVTGKKNAVVVYTVAGSGSVTKKSELEGPENNVNAVRYAPDGKVFVTVDSARKISVFNQSYKNTTESGLCYHSSNINDLAFSPSGARLATGSNDEGFIYWANTEKIEDSRKKVEHAHTNGVTHLEFLDENTLVTTGGERALRVWHLSA